MQSQNHSLHFKIALDIFMFFMLALVYNKRAINMSFHEVGGLCLFGLFIIHNLLNFKWIRNVTGKLFRKKTGNRLRFSWIVNLLLFLSFTVIILTGLMISKTLPFKLTGFESAKQWHYFASAITILLMGVHLGLHWPMMSAMFRKGSDVSRRVLTTIGCILLSVSLCFGGYSMVTGSYARWITAPFSSGSAMPGGGEFKQKDNTSVSDTVADSGSDSGVYSGSEMTDSEISSDGSKGSADAEITSTDGESDSNHMNKGENFRSDMGSQSGFSILNVLKTIATYASEMMLFATVTAIVDTRIRRKHR